MSNSPDIPLLTRFAVDCGDDLLAYLARRLRCRASAADLRQETYLRLYTGPPGGPAEHLHARAFRIAGHLIIDHRRKEAVRLEWQARQLDTEATAPAPEVILMDRQRLAALRRALDALSADRRTAFVLNRLHGRSHAEIAVHMCIAPRTVAKYLAEALRACRLVDDGRRVRLLHGQALFTVAKDTARRFEVEAGSARIRALGTVFFDTAFLKHKLLGRLSWIHRRNTHHPASECAQSRLRQHRRRCLASPDRCLAVEYRLSRLVG